MSGSNYLHVPPLVLDFSTNVLGTEAAQRLRGGKVTQTIRSRKSAAPFLMKRGVRVVIELDDRALYQARITEIKRKVWRDLNQWDAEIGGFNNMKELESAAKRAGFRFKDLGSYEFFAIQFVKVPNTEYFEKVGDDSYRMGIEVGNREGLVTDGLALAEYEAGKAAISKSDVNPFTIKCPACGVGDAILIENGYECKTCGTVARHT